MNSISQKNNNFNHLSLPERKLIQKLFKDGFSVKSIADTLGRHRSTIYRQLFNNKNKDWIRINNSVKRTYVAEIAHSNYLKNKSNCGAPLKLFKDSNLCKYIVNCIKHNKWSPVVAIGRIEQDNLNFNVSVHFRTVYERLSRIAFIFKLKKHNADNVMLCFKKLKKKFGNNFKNIFKSVTADNGSEFFKLSTLENDSFKVYFTHPYSSFEKGGVENYNGLIRRYIPKKTNISKISREKIQAINMLINNTPRKILNFKTSLEVFNYFTNSQNFKIA